MSKQELSFREINANVNRIITRDNLTRRKTKPQSNVDKARIALIKARNHDGTILREIRATDERHVQELNNEIHKLEVELERRTIINRESEEKMMTMLEQLDMEITRESAQNERDESIIRDQEEKITQLEKKVERLEREAAYNKEDLENFKICEQVIEGKNNKIRELEVKLRKERGVKEDALQDKMYPQCAKPLDGHMYSNPLQKLEDSEVQQDQFVHEELPTLNETYYEIIQKLYIKLPHPSEDGFQEELIKSIRDAESSDQLTNLLRLAAITCTGSDAKARYLRLIVRLNDIHNRFQTEGTYQSPENISEIISVVTSKNDDDVKRMTRTMIILMVSAMRQIKDSKYVDALRQKLEDQIESLNKYR